MFSAKRLQICGLLIFMTSFGTTLTARIKLAPDAELITDGMHVTVSRGSKEKVNLEYSIDSTVDQSPLVLLLSPDRTEIIHDVQEWFHKEVLGGNTTAFLYPGKGTVTRLEHHNLADVGDEKIQLDSGKMPLNYFPVLFYIIGGRVFVHKHSGEFGRKREMRQRNAWIRERMEAKTVKELDSQSLPNVLDDDGNAWFIALYDSTDASRCRRPHYFPVWLRNFAGSTSDMSVSVASLDLAIDDHSPVKETEPRQVRSRKDRELFPAYSPVRMQIEHRLSEDVIWSGCPQFITIVNHTFTIFYEDSISKRMRLGKYISRRRVAQLGYKLRRFIRQSLGDATEATPIARHPIMGPFTDIKLEFMTLQKDSKKRVQDPTFILIGATAGFGVLALAVSIFWGLKSSS